ncbi:MAG: hypothetical protein IJL80_01480 [Treponema sp.]|nr:hypothetical protein [Treponema sp.]
MLYKNKIASFKNYDKVNNPMNIPSGYDCADVATYLYGEGMKKTFTGRTTGDLYYNGNPLVNIPDIASTDFFPKNIDNVSFYDEKAFNNANIEIGTIMVWKGPGVKNGKGWNGHVATIVDVTKDKDGNVTNIKIIQGHTGGNKTEVVDIVSQDDLNEYAGTFLGFGEIGKGSTNPFSLLDSIKIFLFGEE